MSAAEEEFAPEKEFVDELEPGTKLMLGQYTIDRFLAAGGFGITYLATDSLRRQVVVKECFPGNFCRRQNHSVVPRSRGHQDELKSIVRLFSQEAKSLAKAGHPNIVRVHQVFEENNTAYMVLDYVEGRDLLSILKEDHESLTSDKIEKLLRKMLDAVGHVHSQGILHRDISPDNILIGKDGEAVLIDFGAAREDAGEKASRLLSELRVVKDGYSPQEFYITGSVQVPSCDLYSLAASFYHIITGELPPDSQSRLSAVAAAEPDPYVSLATRGTAHSEAFAAALDKAISVLPRDRMQTAEEWRAAIDGTEQATPQKEATAQAVRPAKTSSINPIILGSTAMAAAIGAGFFLISTSSDDAASATLEPIETANVSASPTDTNGRADAGRTIERAVQDTSVASVEMESREARPALDVLATTETNELAEIADAPTETAVTIPGVSSVNTVSRQIVALAEAPTTATVPNIANEATNPPAPFQAAAWFSNDIEIARPDSATAQVEPPAQVTGIEVSDQTEPRVVTRADVTFGTVEAASVMETSEPLIPFTLSSDEPGVIESVTDGAPEWLAAGMRIVSVGGEATPTNSDITARITEATTAVGDDATIVIRTDAEIGGAVIERNLEVAVARQTVLLNGFSFATQNEDGTPVTRVIAAPVGSGFSVSDKVVAFMATGEALDGSLSMKELIERELAAGRTNFSFAIERQGEIWVKDFQLAALAN